MFHEDNLTNFKHKYIKTSFLIVCIAKNFKGDFLNILKNYLNQLLSYTNKLYINWKLIYS